MSKLLEFILSEKKSIDEIRKKIRKGDSKIPLFQKFEGLKNKNLFEHLNRYEAIKGLKLADLHDACAINIEEKDTFGYTMLQVYIMTDDIKKVRLLLSLGAVLLPEDVALSASDEMTAFFNYCPGRNQPSILKFCSSRHRADYLEKVNALLYDEKNSTEEESSDAESFSSDSLDEKELEQLNLLKRHKLKNYNKAEIKILADDTPLCLVAARGVHFSPSYFSNENIEQVKEFRLEPHTTYSQSTLFDAGYDADHSVSEGDDEIVERHNYNTNFIEQLKTTKDFKEKKIGDYTPPVTRNKKEFESAYYRFMQVYINSYSTLFNKGSIKKDFKFDTSNNPVVSASWNLEKGAMYGSGARIEQASRRDPHYRRFSGKPKHPNMGYLDLFVFDLDYVKNNSFDRTLQCAEGKIQLNSMYRHEAEVIFISMIPKKFHERRCILSLPSLDKPYSQNKTYFSHYGIKSEKSYKAIKESLNKPKSSDDYKTNITLLSEKAAEGQASKIKKTLDCRLFRENKPKVVVFDHGDTLESIPFTMQV